MRLLILEANDSISEEIQKITEAINNHEHTDETTRRVREPALNMTLAKENARLRKQVMASDVDIPVLEHQGIQTDPKDRAHLEKTVKIILQLRQERDVCQVSS